jgi:hypothetical protein
LKKQPTNKRTNVFTRVISIFFNDVQIFKNDDNYFFAIPYSAALAQINFKKIYYLFNMLLLKLPKYYDIFIFKLLKIICLFNVWRIYF